MVKIHTRSQQEKTNHKVAHVKMMAKYLSYTKGIKNKCMVPAPSSGSLSFVGYLSGRRRRWQDAATPLMLPQSVMMRCKSSGVRRRIRIGQVLMPITRTS